MSAAFVLEVAVPGVSVFAPGDSRCPSKTLAFLMPEKGGLSGNGDRFIRRGRTLAFCSAFSSTNIYVLSGLW